jgi:peroxiredoxin Q/BCP
MRKLLAILTAAIAAASPANAALQVGAKAPNFVTTGAVGGKAFRLNLAEQLRKGPVVLYFFPKAFTSGCTAEAHAFSESIGEFRKAGAQVIGMSADDLPTLKRFSVAECHSAFPVATATTPIIKAYDVSLPLVGKLTNITNRTSYVIDRQGRIVMVHSDMDFSKHVGLTLAAVRRLR